jgi:lipopolysaccharide biosynthesis glycosyltransferase
MIKLFVGYDSRENIAFHVLSHSVHNRASEPVSITPIDLKQLGDLMWRERNPLQSTDFSFSRFLTPFLCGYEGWAIFMDCDMLILDDIAKLWALRDENYSVMCVKHNHVPVEDKKFLGATQTRYEKKNWSSVMLFNCNKCRTLTPEYVNNASGLDLHRFNWLESEDLIGEIPNRWNHLVDYDPQLPTDQISNLHYTVGGPYFDEYKNCSYNSEWQKEKEIMLSAGVGEDSKT